jgi:hypothetical protein
MPLVMALVSEPPHVPPVTGESATQIIFAIALPAVVTTLPVWALCETRSAIVPTPMIARITPTTVEIVWSEPVEAMAAAARRGTPYSAPPLYPKLNMPVPDPVTGESADKRPVERPCDPALITDVVCAFFETRSAIIETPTIAIMTVVADVIRDSVIRTP